MERQAGCLISDQHRHPRGKKNMKISRLLKFTPSVGIGIGAGIAAAILFSLAGRGTLFAALLANLSPLPIMIAMLGFGLAAGAAGVVSATLTVMAVFYARQKYGNLDAAALAGLTFAFFIGLPALWLSLLSVLSRAKGSQNWVITTKVGSFFTREYCPLERVLSYAASISATIGVAIAISVSTVYGGFDHALEKLVGETLPVLEPLLSRVQLPPGVDAHYVAKTLILAAAPAAAGGSLVMMMLNLWFAGRVVQLSGQLPRPWPDIASELRLPLNFLLVFGIASVAGPYLGGAAGLIVVIIAATIGIAFAIVGLAAIHFLTRGLSFRLPLLTLIYLVLVITWPLSLLALLLTGVVETAFSLRARKNKSGPVK
jgi:MFS family permease